MVEPFRCQGHLRTRAAQRDHERPARGGGGALADDLLDVVEVRIANARPVALDANRQRELDRDHAAKVPGEIVPLAALQIPATHGSLPRLRTGNK